LSRLHFIAQET